MDTLSKEVFYIYVVEKDKLTLLAWDFVCQLLDAKGWQMALYRSKDRANKVKVETETDNPAVIITMKKKGSTKDDLP